MNVAKRKNRIVTNIVAIALFIGFLAANIIAFWLCIVEGGLKGINGFINVAADMPIIYIILSIVFTVVLVIYCVFGKMLENTIMTALVSGYGLLLVIGLILLALFSTGNIQNGTLFGIAMWVITVIISPVYGSIWLMGIITVIILLATVVASWVIMIKQLKSKK